MLRQPAAAHCSPGLPAARAPAAARAQLPAGLLCPALQADARLRLQLGHAVAAGVREHCKGREPGQGGKARAAPCGDKLHDT